jgi:GTP-binding protein EngB required for normal cell division
MMRIAQDWPSPVQLRLSDALRGGDSRVDPEALIERINALDRFAAAAKPHLPASTVSPARAVAERAGSRLELSRDHTVVALAGATGSGKSSLFNALAGMDLSAVGVRRPTTGAAHACVWHEAGADALLDWLSILAANRFTRESALDADDQARLRGLVLLDLPDFDSIEAAHRAEVDRLLPLVDLVVWVTDPQKYADQVIHEQYLQMFHRHAPDMVVVLNQADRLIDADVTRCLADLRALLTADGLGGVPMFATSAIGQRPGIDELRVTMEHAVTEREAALHRLGADVDEAVEDLTPLVGSPVGPEAIDRGAARDLSDAFAISAGVPALTEATARAYTFRAGKSMGWPLTRWVRYLRVDPLAQLRLGRATTANTATNAVGDTARDAAENTAGDVATNTATSSASPPPGPIAAQRSTATLAARAVAERASAGLPVPWSAAVTSAAGSRSADLPDALDLAVVGTDLGVDRKPIWWRLVNALQWLLTVAAFAGAVGLLARVGLIALGLPTYDVLHVGGIPLATVVLAGGVLAGILLALLVKPLIALGARRARSRAAGRLRSEIADVSSRYVIEPVRTVLRDYAEARSALADAAR